MLALHSFNPLRGSYCCVTESENVYTKTYPITFWESKDAIAVSLEQMRQHV
jgi:hypothetical protein